MKKAFKPILFAVIAAVISVVGVLSHSWVGIASIHDKEIQRNNLNTENVKYEVVGFGTIARSTDGGKTWEIE